VGQAIDSNLSAAKIVDNVGFAGIAEFVAAHLFL
jgi:hypothetical protein